MNAKGIEAEKSGKKCEYTVPKASFDYHLVPEKCSYKHCNLIDKRLCPTI